MSKIISAVPLGDDMFVTAKKAEVTASGIFLSAGNEILGKQTVIAKGKFVTEIDEGDDIEINFNRFIKKVPKYSTVGRPDMPDLSDTKIGSTETIEVPVYTIDGQEVVKISQYDVLWKYPKDTYLDEKTKLKLN
jgi:hypothetical protein